MLGKLREYKEVLTIVIFFLGGLFWLQNHYPNKDDLKANIKSLEAELQTNRCLLNSYMRLTQLQIRSQDLDKQVRALSEHLSEASFDNGAHGHISLSPAMRMELDQLKHEYKTRQDQYGQTTDSMKRIRDELARGVCKETGHE